MGCAVDEEMNYEKMDGRRELGSSNVYVIYLWAQLIHLFIKCI